MGSNGSENLHKSGLLVGDDGRALPNERKRGWKGTWLSVKGSETRRFTPASSAPSARLHKVRLTPYFPIYMDYGELYGILERKCQVTF